MKKKNLVTLEKMDVIYMDIDDIHPNEYNPNRQSDKDFELLCRSMEEDGFTQPILVQKETKEIVDGEHRWRACKAMGLQKIPVVLVDMTPEQQRISTLRHNRARGNENIARASDVLREIEKLGGLDHAIDSLMMDSVEVQIMLEDIPTTELVLRTPGEKLTVDEVKKQISLEHAFEQEKIDRDNQVGNKERSQSITIAMKMTYQDKKRIEQALEDILPGAELNTQIVALINLYKDNKEAKEFLEHKNE